MLEKYIILVAEAILINDSVCTVQVVECMLVVVDVQNFSFALGIRSESAVSCWTIRPRR